MLRNGTYILENCGISRAVDLNGADHCSLIAHPKHGWANQQWRFTGLGNGWVISSALKPIGDGYVLPLLGSRSGIGYDLTTSSFPVAWDVKGAESPGPKGEGTDAIYQISWPRSDFVLEVNVSEKETKLNLGNKSPCPIEEAALQYWKLSLCEEELSIDAENDPKQDTGEESEDDDASTSTTTTTTVTTTVTKSGRRKEDFITVHSS